MNKPVKRKTRGSIVQRSNDSLSIVVRVKSDGRQLWETVRRQPGETDRQLRDRAEKRLAELVRKQDEGANIVAERLTLGKYLADWLDAYAADHPGSTTPQTYRYLLEGHVIPRIGGVMLPKLTARHVEGVYRAMRDASLSGKTRRHVHRTLSQALKVAVRDGNLARNVCDAVDASLHKPEAPKLEKLTVSEVRQLIDEAGGTEIAAIVPLLAYTGLRIGEALGLRWSDIDFDAAELHVQQGRKRIGKGVYGAPKTAKSVRTVPLTAPVLEALKAYRERQHKEREDASVTEPEHDLVFTRPDGSPVTHDYVTHRWQRIRELAGVPKARVHDLRHFAGTHMIEAGIPPHHVSAVLGHSTVTTTMNMYARSNEDDKRRAIEALARAAE